MDFYLGSHTFRGALFGLLFLCCIAVVCYQSLNRERIIFAEASMKYAVEEPGKNASAVRLTIRARTSQSWLEQQLEVHQSELEIVLMDAVKRGLVRDRDMVREMRRDIMSILEIQGVTQSIEIDLVPDFSRQPPNPEVLDALKDRQSGCI